MRINLHYTLKNFFLLILLFLLTSCGYKDIDKRIFAVAIGVEKPEKEKEKYSVLVKFAVPTADIKAGQKDFIIIKESGDSVTEAIRMIKSEVDKEIDFSHAKMIILGESVLEEDLKETIDWFIRRRDIQKIAWIGVGSPGIEEILELKPKSESLPANALFLSFGRIGTESPYIVTEYLFDLRKRLTEKGIDPVLPIIKVNDFKTYTIKTAVVINKENNIVKLNEEETKVMNILLNRARKLDIKVVKDEDGKKEQYYIAADKASVNYKIYDESQPKVSVKVKLEGIVEESVNELSSKQVKEYEKLAEKQMKERIHRLLTLLQEQNTDPIGLGLLYRANHVDKDDWSKWKEKYGNVEFDIKVDMTLQGTGLLK
ncbi:Ger(x)C family spore germination protein [Bacillus suaedaesalsae]|uniref:Ger(X)C family spore germination protein n=1 Tax=Bacillus suaedaesalsae TaxID=2810349 RepID=A0ABS2DF13_9BACI|nr:Ger(x)C family spore germination protein [Bacillus suaedaesalsae]MBM6617064.1 Ger(x)C family spore germination protein [Bacillus suaedaesalsae]